MKKFLTSTLGLLSLLSVSSASAIVITETYTYSGDGDFNADSTVTEGEFIDFGFDMINTGGLGAVPASFTLTEDAVDADAISPWLSGSLSMDLYSVDFQFEITSLTVMAQNTSTLEVMLLDIFFWNRDSILEPIYSGSYNFTNTEMGIFNDWGWANVSIGATSTGVSGFNDFAISRVSMSVTDVATVPEPGTLLLLSAGLLGFIVTSRNRKKS